MKKIGQLNISSKHIFIILGILFILSIIPMLIISFYAHQSGDDYFFGVLTHDAIVNGGGIGDILGAAIEKTSITYQDWQGTYSAIFLMALQPGVWGENFYFLTTFILLFSLIFAHCFLLKVVFKNYFNASRYNYWIIAIVVLTLCIQFLPSALQGFYWYNGGIYYTFFHSLMLILFGIMLLAINNQQFQKRKIVYYTIMSLLCFIIGGGNYVTALLTVLVYLLFLGYLCIHKKMLKNNWFFFIPFVILVGGFLASIIAPGNAIRQQGITDTPSAFKAILLSFKNAVDYSDRWLTLPLIIAVLFLIPFLFKIAQNSKFSFRFPIIISLLSFCLYAAMFCPPIFAMNNIGDDRLVNIIYYTYILLLVGNLFYWIGWAIRKYETFCTHRAVNAHTLFNSITIFLKKYAIPGILCIGILFSISVFACYRVPTSSTASAVYSLLTGEAQSFKAQEDERVKIYNDSTVKEVYLKPFTVKPYLLYYDWMETIPLTNIANYYNKDTVELIKSE